MTTVHLLHAGYAGERVASSIVLVQDADARIVVDPGMVARRSLILDPLAALGVSPEAVTHVFLSHHHPDHTLNIALFPNAEVVDFWARYRDDQWLDHDGDGYRLAPSSQLWLTPGHTEEDATLVVDAEDGVYAMTHLWWREDRTPDQDPLAVDQAAIDRHRKRVLATADIVIPGQAARSAPAACADRARAAPPGRAPPLRPDASADPRRDEVQADVVDEAVGMPRATAATNPSRSAGGRRSRCAPGSPSAGTPPAASRARSKSARRSARRRCPGIPAVSSRARVSSGEANVHGPGQPSPTSSIASRTRAMLPSPPHCATRRPPGRSTAARFRNRAS